MKNYNYVYKIVNLTNGKIYVGQHCTDNLNDKYMGSGKLIKEEIKRCGVSNFIKEILVFVDNVQDLNKMEKYYIKKYNSTDKEIGYNLNAGGAGGYYNNGAAPMSTHHHSEETKKWLKAIHLGKNHPMFGRKMKDLMDPISYKNMIEKRSETKRNMHYKKHPKQVFVRPDGSEVLSTTTLVKKFHSDWILKTDYEDYITANRTLAKRCD